MNYINLSDNSVVNPMIYLFVVLNLSKIIAKMFVKIMNCMNCQSNSNPTQKSFAHEQQI